MSVFRALPVRRAKAVPPLKKVIATLQLPVVRTLASKAPMSQAVTKGRTKPAPRWSVGSGTP